MTKQVLVYFTKLSENICISLVPDFNGNNEVLKVKCCLYLSYLT